MIVVCKPEESMGWYDKPLEEYGRPLPIYGYPGKNSGVAVQEISLI